MFYEIFFDFFEIFLLQSLDNSTYTEKELTLGDKGAPVETERAFHKKT